ncbi:MAG: hypothetical protein HYV66_02180 [Candidatus Sungbacteria bacterium]|uniref:Uncharacterized protein n=1 Tax=Candidatus Sungiibacteriota bacterium TaxID=2750080 RepID=A0A932DSK9_9BACT|nr:hypothetical protein [Candidatus Sungbacteria bacterium]
MEMKNFIEKYKLYIILIIVLVGIGYFIFNYAIQNQRSNLGRENNGNTSNIDPEKLAEAIKRAEAQQPPGIGASPSETEIYNNPFVKHIRVALNGYLDSSNQGIDDPDYIINGSDSMLNCGLKKFDKSYYKSKFIVFDVSNNDYGGVQADIVFTDKPDTIFWTWVYKLTTENDEEGYTLRGFCSNGPKEEFKKEFPEMMKEIIKKSKFFL